MTLTFGKFKGQKLDNTPDWYKSWLMNQDWFINKFMKPKKVENLYDKLKGWDGYSARGQAIYNKIFEMEMNEGIVMGIQCKCGLDKLKSDDYCQGDYCYYDYL